MSDNWRSSASLVPDHPNVVVEQDGPPLTPVTPNDTVNIFLEVPSEPATPTVQNVAEVLATRPAVVRGQRLSMRRREPPRFSRGDAQYSSMPHRHTMPYRPPTAPVASDANARGKLRRHSSLPNIASMDFETLNVALLNRELRRSTRRLKERIAVHREVEQHKPKAARDSLWANFRYVKWPKIKSQLRVLKSYELWKGHMKEVEGHFGTGVVSYFIFLRWLFVMNLILVIFWLGFIVVPQIIWEINNSTSTTSLATCVFPDELDFTGSLADMMTNMTDNTTITSNTTDPLESTTLNRTCMDGNRNPTMRLYDASFCMPSTGALEIRFCEFSDSDTAFREGAMTASVVSSSDGCSELNGTNRLVFCNSNIAPRVEWFGYIVNFLVGQGLFNDTLLFHGRYTNTTVVGNTYDMPLAFLFVTLVVYALSVLLLVYKIGSAYNESYVQFSSKRKVNFCNKMFSAWDFNITDPKTAKLKRVHIRTDFEEELADFKKRNQERTTEEIVEVVLIRIATNVFTTLVLAGAGVAIFYAAQFNLDFQQSSPNSGFLSILVGLLPSGVITILNIILPFLFSFLARFERFKTHNGEIKMTLLRAIIVRLSSLVVLITTLFILIRCSQAENDATDEQTCRFNLNRIIVSTANGTNSTNGCTECWETFIGQEFYKLGLTNFAVTLLSTIGVETSRHIFSKFGQLGAKVGKGTFDIPKSILDLIYTQSVLWLGLMFCPLLPVVILLTTFLLFYIKKYSLIWNLTPNKRATFRAARTNFLFVFLLFLSLFVILVPVGVTVSSLRPSVNCGPFRNQMFMVSVVTDLISQAPCTARQALDYFASAGFVVPIIILLLLVIYGQFVVMTSRNARFQLIKKQLILEGANVAHIVGGLRGGQMKRLQEQRQMSIVPEEIQIVSLGQRMRVRADSGQNIASESTF